MAEVLLAILFIRQVSVEFPLLAECVAAVWTLVLGGVGHLVAGQTVLLAELLLTVAALISFLLRRSYLRGIVLFLSLAGRLGSLLTEVLHLDLLPGDMSTLRAVTVQTAQTGERQATLVTGGDKPIVNVLELSHHTFRLDGLALSVPTNRLVEWQRTAKLQNTETFLKMMNGDYLVPVI